jgi:pimeloyl-ACP methyl ester carboxylesterase
METRTISANGLTFAADVEGDGDTVALLLHGFPECRESWRDQLEPLADLGWKAVAPDMRGYGESSRPRGLDAYRIDRLVDDVAGLFEALGARRRVLAGHDWGGVIAWQAALRGLALDGLVILNAPHPSVFQREIRTWEQRRKSWYVLFFLLPFLPELQLTWRDGSGLASSLAAQAPSFPADLLETFRRNVTAPGAATAMLNYYRANALSLPAPGPGNPPIDTPTLMVWGEDDAFLGRSLTVGNDAFVSDFTLKRLPGVSHWVLQDAPALVSAMVSEWARGRGLADPDLSCPSGRSAG